MYVCKVQFVVIIVSSSSSPAIDVISKTKVCDLTNHTADGTVIVLYDVCHDILQKYVEEGCGEHTLDEFQPMCGTILQ